jgi:hypothetical protein
MDPHDAQLHINYTQDVFPIHRLVKGLREVADAGMSVLVCETRVRLNELARCVCCCTCVRLLQRSAALHNAERAVCACVLLRFARGQLLWAAPARVSGTLQHTAACQTHPWLTRLLVVQLPFNFDLVDWDASWNATRLKSEVVKYLTGLPRGAVPDWVLGARHLLHLAAPVRVYA